MTDMVVKLLAKLDETEQTLAERAVNPFEGWTDDQLHDRSAHPAYQYSVTEGQRKAWDNDMDPPAGDGWELNRTSACPQAWSRFDYHEERYWRRLRPEGPQPWQPPADVTLGLGLCQAHRQIIDLCREMVSDGDGHARSWSEEIVRKLAEGYGIKDEEEA